MHLSMWSLLVVLVVSNATVMSFEYSQCMQHSSSNYMCVSEKGWNSGNIHDSVFVTDTNTFHLFIIETTQMTFVMSSFLSAHFLQKMNFAAEFHPLLAQLGNELPPAALHCTCLAKHHETCLHHHESVPISSLQ